MVKENILRIKERISSDAITIVAVSKGRSIDEVREAIAAGIADIGENKVQEAALKYDGLRTTEYPSASLRAGGRRIKWHMVGHLQTNKAKEAVRIFDLIHSVDSIGLAQELDKHAARINKTQDILIEVKTSQEPAKFGIKPEETIEVIKEIVKLKNINIKGLMTIAPAVGNPEEARPYFKTLRELQDKINGLRLVTCDLRLLSMGMTDDFEVAIEEGANMLRLGRAIFGR